MKFLTLFSFILSALALSAQPQPVKWTMEEAFDGEHAAIIIKATIDKDWKIYSRKTGDGGPIPTSIVFSTDDSVVLADDYLEQEEPDVMDDELFEMEVATFKDEAIFVMPIVKAEGGSTIKATVTFMTCSGMQCLPPTDVELALTLSKGAGK